MRIVLDESNNLGKHLLGSVFYDPDTMKILKKGVSTHNLKGKKSIEAIIKISKRAWKKNARMADIYLKGQFQGKLYHTF